MPSSKGNSGGNGAKSSHRHRNGEGGHARREENKKTKPEASVNKQSSGKSEGYSDYSSDELNENCLNINIKEMELASEELKYIERTVKKLSDAQINEELRKSINNHNDKLRRLAYIIKSKMLESY